MKHVKALLFCFEKGAEYPFNKYNEFEKSLVVADEKGGWLITPGWQTFAMHRFGQIGPTVNRMQRHRTNWPGNYQRSAGPMRAAPGPANWANGRLDQRSSAAMNDAASGRWGWRERVGGKKYRAWGGDVMPAREGYVRRRRVIGHSSRARQPADLGGGGGAGGQRAGSARDRAGSRPSGPNSRHSRNLEWIEG